MCTPREAADYRLAERHYGTVCNCLGQLYGEHGIPDDEESLRRRLHYVYDAAATGLLRTGKILTSKLTEDRYLSAAHALGCSESVLDHYWDSFGQWNERYRLWGLILKDGRPKSSWKEPKIEFGPRKGQPAQLTRNLVLRHLLEYSYSISLPEPLEAIVAATALSSKNDTWIVTVDFDRHPVKVIGPPPGIRGKPRVFWSSEMKLPNGRYEEVYSIDSVKSRLDLVTKAFETPAAMLVSSPHGFHAFWVLQNYNANPRTLVKAAKTILKRASVTVYAGYIEVLEVPRLPLGYRSRVFDITTFEPLFAPVWNRKGLELEYLRRALPLPVRQDWDAGLFSRGIPPHVLGPHLLESDSKSGQLSNGRPPDDVGERSRPRRRYGNLTLAEAQRLEQLERAGLTAHRQQHTAIRDMTRLFAERDGLVGDALAEATFAWISANHNGMSNRFSSDPDYVRDQCADLARRWPKVRYQSRAESSEEDPDLSGPGALLKRIPRAIYESEARLILSLTLTPRRSGKSDLASELVVALLFNFARLFHEENKLLVQPGQSIEFTLSNSVLTQVAPERRVRQVVADLGRVFAPGFSSPLLRRSMKGTPEAGASRYQLAAPMGVSCIRVFPCYEAAVTEILDKDQLLVRYGKVTVRRIRAAASSASTAHSPLTWASHGRATRRRHRPASR